jgi:hypothetical protein
MRRALWISLALSAVAWAAPVPLVVYSAQGYDQAVMEAF